jgi:hypothetical protein
LVLTGFRNNFDIIWNPESDGKRKEFFAFCEKMEQDPKLAEAGANVRGETDVDRVSANIPIDDTSGPREL